MSDDVVENVDYYIEHGLWVFTAHYLQRRGYCCWSHCRHCPYGYGGGVPDPEFVRRHIAERQLPGSGS